MSEFQISTYKREREMGLRSVAETDPWGEDYRLYSVMKKAIYRIYTRLYSQSATGYI